MTKQHGDSQFWSGLMEIKDLFLVRGKFSDSGWGSSQILGGLVDWADSFDAAVPFPV